MSEQLNDLPSPELANLLDKRAWHDIVEDRIAAAELNGTPASVIFIDINGMKAVNDTYGHDEGDRLIAGISGLLGAVSQTLRLPGENVDGDDSRGDIISFGQNLPDSIDPERIESEPGHIGGDEFAVYADTDEIGSRRIEERVRSAFIDYIERPENDLLRLLGVGIAIGHATLEKGMTAAELTKKADEAMYADKKSQLPELTPEQRRLLNAARFCLEEAGLNWRSAAKYFD